MYRIMILPEDYNVFKLAEFKLKNFTKRNDGHFFYYVGFNSYTVNLDNKLCKLWLLDQWVDREVYEILRDGADLEVYLHFKNVNKGKPEKKGNTVHLGEMYLIRGLGRLLKDM